MIRILLGLLLIIFLLFGYWWLPWLLAIVLLFYFPIYYEIIALGIIYDSIFGFVSPEMYNIKYISTIVSVVLLFISILIKKVLIVYESANK